MDSDDDCFETKAFDPKHMTQQAANTLQKGSYVMIKGIPCEVITVKEIPVFRKNGYNADGTFTPPYKGSETHVTARDVFNGTRLGTRLEYSWGSSNPVEIPFVNRMEYVLA